MFKCTSCKYGKNKGSRLNMCSFTWLVQIVTWPEQFNCCLHLEKMITASKLQNKRLVKYVNIKIWQRFLVHVIFRVSSINIWIPEHVSGVERGAGSAERSVRNIVGARSGFLSKGRSDRSVSLLFRSDTAHTTSLGHAQIHPEFTCAFNN